MHKGAFIHLTWLFLALTMQPANARALEEVPLNIVVNQVEEGDHIVLLHPDGTVFVSADDLRKMRFVNLPEGTRVGGTEYISLAALVPHVSYELDSATLTLHVTADPLSFDRQRVNVAQGAPKDLIHTDDDSAYLNYSLGYTLWDAQQAKALDVPLEIAFNWDGTHFFSSHAYQRSETKAQTHDDFTRLMTNLRWDDPAERQTLVLGDFFASSGDLGGGGLLGGVSLMKNYTLTPYFIRTQQLGLSGTVTTPSQVELYLNGILVTRKQLLPGPFDITNIPRAMGSGEAVLVITDAFGRTERIVLPYYIAPQLLKPGLQEYAYSLGSQRVLDGEQSDEYGEPAFLGYHRYGFSDDVTAGVRAETGNNRVNAGLTATFRLWRAGELHMASSHSREGNIAGQGSLLSYRYATSLFNLGLSAKGYSRNYANLSLAAEADKSRLSWSSGLGLRLGSLGSLGVQYSASEPYEADSTTLEALFLSGSLFQSVSLYAQFSRLTTYQDAGPQVDRMYVVGASTTFGTRHSGSLSHADKDGVGTDRAAVQRSVPRGTGFGYRLGIERNEAYEQEETGGDAFFQYNGPHGIYSTRYSRTNGESTRNVLTAGSAAYIDHGLYWSRPIYDSFAVVRVKGVEDVRVYSSNQEVGRTNVAGESLVPGLTSYYGNDLSVDEQDIPMDLSIGNLRKYVAPSFRSGTVVNFEVTKIQAFTGFAYFLIEGRKIPAEYAGIEVNMDGKIIQEIVGKGGEIYLENLKPGTYPARLFNQTTDCRFTLAVPKSDALFVDLGEVICEVE